MRKLLIFIPLLLLAFCFTTSCKFAPSHNLGDTVAAKDFEPISPQLAKKHAVDSTKQIADSADIFVVGEASNRKMIQLISYPSHRDTLLFKKKRHIKVVGNANEGSIVRVEFVQGKDSTKEVRRMEEIKLQ